MDTEITVRSHVRIEAEPKTPFAGESEFREHDRTGEAYFSVGNDLDTGGVTAVEEP